MMRSLLAVIGGYIAMAIGIALTTFVVGRLFPGIVLADGTPNPDYIAMNLVYSAVFATLGGYVTACIGGQEPVKHAVFLAGLCYIFFALFIFAPNPEGSPPTPVWYKIGLLIELGPAVTLGGFLRLRQLRNQLQASSPSIE